MTLSFRSVLCTDSFLELIGPFIGSCCPLSYSCLLASFLTENSKSASCRLDSWPYWGPWKVGVECERVRVGVCACALSVQLPHCAHTVGHMGVEGERGGGWSWFQVRMAKAVVFGCGPRLTHKTHNTHRPNLCVTIQMRLSQQSTWPSRSSILP